MRSWLKPTPEQVDHALVRLGRAAAQRYFFERLDNPEWIEPLLKAGFFQHPPKPERDEIEGTVAFPFWPDMSFLVRMAPLKPDLVAGIAEKIDTENVRVQEDLAEIALRLPPPLAARMARKARPWVRSRFSFMLPNRLAKLAVHLAEGGEVDAAFVLASALLEIHSERRRKATGAGDDDDAEFAHRPTLNEAWHYGETLRSVIPALTVADGPRALDVVSRLVESTIALQQRDTQGDGEDYSYVWRRAIEAHEQDHVRNRENFLVDALRDAAETLLKNGTLSVEYLVGFFEQRRWAIFHRLALHLLIEAAPAGRELSAERLLRRDLFDEPRYRHEYARLLENRFSELGVDAQRQIIAWITDGPDLTAAAERHQRFRGVVPTAEELEKHKRYWIRNHLAWFGKSLPDALAPLMQDLVAELGEPMHPTLSSYSVSRWGPTSPKSDDELRRMTIPEILAFIGTWQASGDEWDSSWAGLAQVLQTAATERAGEFAAAAEDFRDIPPTCVRSIFWGLANAVSNGTGFPWRPVLALCSWVCRQPRGEVRTRESLEEDGGWVEARRSIPRLLNAGLQSDASGIAIELREAVWEVVETLTNDPDPTTEQESGDETRLDPATLAINTIRGEAMHAVVQYALWLRRYFDVAEPEKGRAGFDPMPEVRRALERHLDVHADPSLAVRSVYGQFFPWLVLIDAGWSQAVVNCIFPSEGEARCYWGAAWGAYILFNNAYDNVFDRLQATYRLAIERLGQDTKSYDNREAETRLGGHLVHFSWRGKVGFGKDDLLWQFMEVASPSGRERTIEFIGESLLAAQEEDVPDGLAGELRAFWEARLEAAKHDENSLDRRAEVGAFVSWFASGKLGDDWAFQQLREILGLRVGIRFRHSQQILARLSTCVVSRPGDVIAILRSLLIEDAQEHWPYFAGDKEVVKIVKAVYDGPDLEAKRTARELIDTLGARGFIELRDML
jgi:hypothetical protein